MCVRPKQKLLSSLVMIRNQTDIDKINQLDENHCAESCFVFQFPPTSVWLSLHFRPVCVLCVSRSGLGYPHAHVNYSWSHGALPSANTGVYAWVCTEWERDQYPWQLLWKQLPGKIGCLHVEKASTVVYNYKLVSSDDPRTTCFIQLNKKQNVWGKGEGNTTTSKAHQLQ